MLRKLQQEWVTLQLVPDRYLDNHNTDKLADALHNLYRPLAQRVKLDTKQLQIDIPDRAWWEISLTADRVAFYLVSPRHWLDYVRNQVNTCWPGVTPKETDGAHLSIPAMDTVGANMQLALHHFFSMETDRRLLAPLPALLEVSRAMGDGDKALVQICLDPAPPDWYMSVQDAQKLWQRGGMPRRAELNARMVLRGLVTSVAGVANEVRMTMAEMLGGEEIEREPILDPERYEMLRHGEPAKTTLTKGKGEAFDLTMRLLVHGPNPSRRKTILRSLVSAYKTIGSDNHLVAKEAKDTAQLVRQVAGRQLPARKINRDYISTSEAGKLLMLPPNQLQEEFPAVQNVPNREIVVPDCMLKGGMMLGHVTVKGKRFDVYRPLHNPDETCRVHVVVGPPGSGKTLGVGAGHAADAIRNGMSVFVIDVTDGDLSYAVMNSLPADFPDDHLVVVDHGNTEWPPALNWGELARPGARARDVANAMAVHLQAFLDKFASEAGDRTGRYIKAAAQVVFKDRTGGLLDFMLMLTSKAFRQQKLQDVTNPRLLDLWNDFDNHMSDGMRAAIIAPILNRLDALVGMDNVANSLLQSQPETWLDYRKYADGDEAGPYCVLIKIPKGKLMGPQTDALATYHIAKVWLSVLTRGDQPTAARKPAQLIMDEPHQFLGSAIGGVESTWGQMLAEARKWRLGLMFLFQGWDQIKPAELRNLLMEVGPHFTIYSRSPATFAMLSEQIKPFTPEEATRMTTHQAINIILADGEYHRFICDMGAPPINIKAQPPKSWRYQLVDRTARAKACSRIYGKHVDQVEAEIYEREKILLQQETADKRRGRK